MIQTHMTWLRDHPVYGRAKRLVMPEANMSFTDADRIRRLCMEIDPVRTEVLSRDPMNLGRAGVWTAAYHKQAYAEQLRDIIRERRLYFAADLICEPKQKQSLRTELITQLRQFREERKDPLDVVFGVTKHTYSGKNAAGQQDDLVLALMISLYWGHKYRESEDFMLYCQTTGTAWEA